MAELSELLDGVSFHAFAMGNRRIIRAVKARTAKPEPAKPDPCEHPDHTKNPAHADHCPSHPAPQKPATPPEDAEHPFLAWAKWAGGTIGVLILLWPMIGKWVPTAAVVTLTLWVITALIAGQTDPDAEATKESAETPAAEAPQERPTPPTAPTVPTPADARRAVALLGAPGGHVALTAATAHLAASHPLWKRSGKATKALLQEAGIRVRDGVKVAGVSVPGIHQDDVPPLPSLTGAAPGGAVVPGQSNNNNHNNAPAAPPREGFTTQPDPDNPARTIVVHAA